MAARAQEPIAIVGAAGRFAGAPSLGALWRLASSQKSALGPPPPGRWSEGQHHRGGFLDDVFRFDAARFGIADDDARALDPQQRLLLTVVDEAVKAAPAFASREVAVVVAGAQLAYYDEVRAALKGQVPRDTLAGNLLSMLATRVAHTFDLRGPALTVDTACSGSLVALHEACKSLRMGECEAAIVGGVNVNLTPMVHELFARAGALSKSGRLIAFGDDADGTLPADGVGAVVLCPLSLAKARGHRVWATVLGSAVNNCGRTIGVMAPRPEGQIDVMRLALERAGVLAADVRFLEAHATGTKIGDAIERKSIAAVYGDDVRLGAIKAQVGHALGAAGMAGLLRVLGELNDGELGAVNAFGFGGTNAHVVLQGGDVPASAREQTAAPARGRIYRLRNDAAVDDELEAELRRWVHVVERDHDGAVRFSSAPRGESGLVRRGAYVITGASGGIGRELARHLARNFRARLFLVGRRQEDDELTRFLEELRALGAEARYLSADLTAAGEGARVATLAREQLVDVDGLFHAAGSLADDAMAVKRDGLLCLSGLFPKRTVLFSSLSGLVPGLAAGLERYAEANRWLDEHARAKSAEGERVQSVAFAPWSEVGMAAEFADELGARGVTPVSPSLALSALERALSSGAANLAVMERAPDSLATGNARGDAVISDSVISDSVIGDSVIGDSVIGDWRATLKELIAEVAELPVSVLDDERHLTALGVDSLAAIDIVKALEERSGRSLPATFLFEHDTIAKLAAALEELAPALPSSPLPSSPPSSSTLPSSTLAATAAPADVRLLDAQRTFLVQQRYYPTLPCNVLLAVTLRASGSASRSSPLEREALTRALATLVERHPVLRSRVARDGEAFVQRADGPAPQLEWVSHLDDEAVANRAFDLEQGPLLRVVSDGTRLALNAQHLLLDAWSAKLCALELLALHEHELGAAPLPPPPPAADHAIVAEALRTAQLDDGALAYWRERFAGGVPPLPLPYDFDVAAAPAGPARAPRLTLPAETTKALLALARQESVTLPALVLASYLRLLFDVSGQHDVVVRVANARRDARVDDIGRVLGSFADSLPVRALLHVGESLGALARRVQAELVDAQRHAGASSLALAALSGRASSGPQGMTPAGFSFLRLDADARVGALELDDVHGASASGFTRLGLIGWIFDGRLTLSFNYLADHFRDDTVAGFLERHRRILERAASNDVVSDLRSDVSVGSPARLDARLVEACDRFRDRTLMKGLTFGALGAASLTLAARVTGPRVAVLADPGAPALTGVLAALRAGAAYVPLDPRWPDARIRGVLEVARPSSLVVDSVLAARASALFPSERTAAIDVAELVAARKPDHVQRADDSLAWIMFTSGSTGSPKGVCVSHSSALVFLDWVERMLGVREDDCFLQTSGLGFGGSIRQMFSPVLAGARMVPADASTKQDPAALLSLLHDERVTIYNSVPSMWSFVMDAIEREGAQAVRSLRWVLLGGEAVPAAYVRRWHRLVPGVPRVANLYGSTESVVNATWFEAGPGALDDDETMTPIGWPRYGCELALDDEDEGGASELSVRGAIADGYFEGERFGEGYRTGDLVRRTKRGALVYVGRRDSQVQIYGNRVELGEIEATLCLHPLVAAAAVSFVEERLRAVVEVRGASVAAEELRAFVADKLPSFMVPHVVELRSALPRTAAGKTDRRALGADGGVRDALAAVWREVLRLDQLPADDDDFFALGGDSMLALEMLTRLRERTGRALSPLQVHRSPTLAALREALLEQDASAAASTMASARVPAVTKEAPAAGASSTTSAPAGVTLGLAPSASLPLGPVQRGFWLASSAGQAPLLSVSLPLRGPLDVDALERAVHRVQERHPLLRATFSARAQRPASAPFARVQYEDLEPLGVVAARAALSARRQEEREVTLPLERGPLLRLRVCRLAEDEHELLLTAHHIVLDAYSAWLLLDELLHDHAQLQREQGGAPVVPELRYAAETAPRAPAHDDHWRQFVSSLPVEPTPPSSTSGHRARLDLDARAFGRLRSAARRAGTSAFALLFTELAEALLEARGVDALVLATAVSGRERDPVALAAAVGPFAHALPVVVRQGGEAQNRARLVEALAHAGSALDSLPARLGAERAASLGRYFLSWLEPPAALSRGPLVPVWGEAELSFQTQSTATELSVAALAREDGLTLHLRGGALTADVAAVLEQRLARHRAPRSALVLYAPAGTSLPFTRPTLVETVRCAAGTTDLVLLPLDERGLSDEPRLYALLSEALGKSDAETVALAGMLPSRTGLARTSLSSGTAVLTTGHAATVVAMLKTLELALSATGRAWRDARVAALGFGAIGRATLSLAVAKLGAPRSVLVVDPRYGSGSEGIGGCDLVLAATSGGRAIDVDRLAPGTLVLDDSFPRAFDDEAAWRRMEAARDVLLVGGGMLDAGPLERSSPFPEAAAVRATLPSRWLPGCHAEAVLVAARPELGATVGEVELPRALCVLEAIDELGWRAAPLHLGPREIPLDVIRALASARRIPA